MNYMENQIVWESRQEDLTRLKKDALVFYDPKRNPNDPPRYLYNKDLFILENGNTEEKKYVLSLHKIHEISFPKEDLGEKMIQWVSKVFKTFNEEVRLSIQHWKDSWHKRMYKIKHMKERANPEEVLSNHKIVEVLGIECDQIKINLTAPTLKFIGIEACNPYSIIDEPFVEGAQGSQVEDFLDRVQDEDSIAW
ncbi:hypothetical protein Tco_0863515 [Tanacetum coccineum]